MALSVAAFAIPLAAHAQTFTYSVELDTLDPTFNRPIANSSGASGLSGVGSDVPYEVIPVTVNDGGNFGIT